MRSLLAPLLFAVGLSSAVAQEPQRFVERTPPPTFPPQHTPERAGNPTAVSRFAVPSPGRFTGVGYVGGGQLHGNHPLDRGYGVVSGATTAGVFGSDFIGFRLRPGRVFLGESADPSRGPALARGYRTDATRVPDVIAPRPIRNAVIEANEVERK